MKTELMKSLQKLSKETLREMVEELMTRAEEQDEAIRNLIRACAIRNEALERYENGEMVTEP